MPSMSVVRPRSRPQTMAPIDCLVGMALLAGAALMILPVMAALSAFALIAAVARGRSPKPRPIRIAPTTRR
ncbi:MAG: hypothetical protein K2P68_10670 [Sphingomonas sp.]|nr:hypothetical protein [Sphingomonas sp.]